MPTLKRFISAVEAAEQIMQERSDDENNDFDTAILPPGNVDSQLDDEEVQDDDVMIDSTLPSDVCGMMQVQTNFLNWEDNDDEVEDDGNAKEEQIESRAQNEKEKRVLELLKDVEECKSKSRSWMSNIPVKHQFLEPINEESKSNKLAKNDIENNLVGKPPHEIFEQYVNAELKLKILEERNRYAAQKNTITSFNAEDLETFNSILLLLVITLSHKEECFGKKKMI